jgi:hypothetical protein
MLQNHERHPGVGGQVREETFQRVESAGRRADAYDMELRLFAWTDVQGFRDIGGAVAIVAPRISARHSVFGHDATVRPKCVFVTNRGFGRGKLEGQSRSTTLSSELLIFNSPL